MSFEGDWVFLRAALPDLRDYVLSNDVYWPMHPPARSPSGLQLPQLTIGTLMLSQTRLKGAVSDAEQEQDLEELVQAIQAVRTQWRSNWGNKAAREWTMRLNLWQQYMRDLRADGRQQSAYYANEVRQRAILHLLEAELNDGAAAQAQTQMAMLDQILRGLSQSGPFVWEPEAASAFPQETFWYLYMTVHK